MIVNKKKSSILRINGSGKAANTRDRNKKIGSMD